MNRIIFFVVLCSSLALAHHGYAGKTRVAPNTVNLLGEPVNALSVVGIQSDGKFIVGGNFGVIDGRGHKKFVRLTADGQVDSSWGGSNTYTSLAMDGDDVYATWLDSARNRYAGQLDEYGRRGAHWIYKTTNDLTIGGINSTDLFALDGESLVKINKGTGIAGWSYTPNHGFIVAMYVENAKVYIAEVGSDFDSIAQFDVATGARDWRTSIGSGWVTGMASDGTSLYYAYFYGGYFASRISIASGILDTNWFCETYAEGYPDIRSLAVDDTGVYVGGSFTQINGVDRSGLAKIDKTNSLPSSNWNVNVPGLEVTAFQTDATSIYAIGSSSGMSYLARIDTTTASVEWIYPLNGYRPSAITIAGASVFLTAQNDDGTITSFAIFDKSTGHIQAFLGNHVGYDSATVKAFTRQSDGKMYIGGDFVTANGFPHSGLVRLNADGSVDNGWRYDLRMVDYHDFQSLKALAIDNTGLYVALDYSWVVGSYITFANRNIYKLTTSRGTANVIWQYIIRSSFAWEHSISMDDESLYIGNKSYSDTASDCVTKLNKMTGEVASQWNSGKFAKNIQGQVDALVVDGNSLYVAGLFTEIGGQQRTCVAKLNNTTGEADADWDAQWPFCGSLSIGAMVVGRSSVYIGGGYTDTSGHRHWGIVKLDKKTGHTDSDWHCHTDGTVNCLAVDNGWIYVGGGFNIINGVTRSHVARLNKLTGAVDPNWIHNTDGDVACLLVANGSCYLGGSFTKIGLQDHFGFGAILPALNSTPGDYDGDHIADLALYNPSTGQWIIKLSKRTTPRNFLMTAGPSWIPVRGDFDGDGRTDPALYSPDLGQFAVKASAHGYTEYYVALGGPGCIPMPGDYDNDGVTDFMVYLPSYGLWTGLLSSSDFMPATLPTLGGPDWQPVAGDFNGDGCCDPAVYNESTGQWRVLDSSKGYQEIDVSITLGGPGFQAMSGDFDGDGCDDLAVYSSALGEWEIALSAMGYAQINIMCGGEGYMPIPGDYDGDGIADIGVYSAAQGQGIALMSSSRTFVPTTLGGPGYRPCNP